MGRHQVCDPHSSGVESPPDEVNNEARSGSQVTTPISGSSRPGLVSAVGCWLSKNKATSILSHPPFPCPGVSVPDLAYILL